MKVYIGSSDKIYFEKVSTEHRWKKVAIAAAPRVLIFHSYVIFLTRFFKVFCLLCATLDFIMCCEMFLRARAHEMLPRAFALITWGQSYESPCRNVLINPSPEM